jgi:hypothetical protein
MSPLFSLILFQKTVKHGQRGWDIDFLKHETGSARTINRQFIRSRVSEGVV